MNDRSPWRLSLLGEPKLTAPDGRELRLEGKALALLAYLGLEVSAPRSRLAGLLWPERGESAARNNLVQLLRRMDASFGAEFVVRQEILTLSDDLQVDVRALDDDAEVPTSNEPLLRGVAFDHLDLADWLAAQRERLDARRARAAHRAAVRAEGLGDLAAATRLAERALDLDPLSEEAYRRVMRLMYLRGDARAALQIYHRLERVLRDELRTHPMQETADLARLIERGETLPSAGRERSPAPTKLSTPRLVGREAEWARMETAWAAGQFIIVAGVPGMGKTRLAREFAASKGRVLFVEARPGDTLVPYTTTIRSLRRSLEASGVTLPPELRRPLSFLLPELAPDGEAPPERADPNLHGALQQAFGMTLQQVDAYVFDDMQYADEASVDVGFEFIDAVFPMGRPGGMPHFIVTHREEGLPEFTRRIFERLERAGQALWLHVPPLDEASSRELLSSMGVEGVDGLAEASDGHPLFLLEGAGAVAAGRTLSASPTVPPQLGALLADRLARLPKMALHVARACALLRRDFTPELVAGTLSAPLLDVVRAWSELEDARVLTGERFHHDLVGEAVLEGIPASVRRLLHRGAARALTAEDAPAARIAWHWREGGQDLEAASWLLRAGASARTSLRIREAAALFEEAARLFEAHDDARSFDAWLQRATAWSLTDQVEARQTSINDVLERATTPRERVEGWILQAGLYALQGEGVRAEKTVRRCLTALEGHDEPRLRASLLGSLCGALWTQGRTAEAETAIREALSLLEPLGPSDLLAAGLSNLGVMLDTQDRQREAVEIHRRAVEMLGRLGDLGSLPAVLVNLAVSLGDVGDGPGSLDALRQALRLHETQGQDAGANLHLMLGIAHFDLGEYAAALGAFERVLSAHPDSSDWWREYARACLSRVLGELGQHERAAALVGDVDTTQMPPSFLARVYLAAARLAAARGQDPTDDLTSAAALLEESPRPLLSGRLLLLEADQGSADAARAALDLGSRSGLDGVCLTAHARLARLLWLGGEREEASRHADAAHALLSTVTPVDASVGEVLLDLFEASGERRDETLRRATDWFEHTRSNHVPPEARADFETRSVVARRLARLAQHTAPR